MRSESLKWLLNGRGWNLLCRKQPGHISVESEFSFRRLTDPAKFLIMQQLLKQPDVWGSLVTLFSSQQQLLHLNMKTEMDVYIIHVTNTHYKQTLLISLVISKQQIVFDIHQQNNWSINRGNNQIHRRAR